MVVDLASDEGPRRRLKLRPDHRVDELGNLGELCAEVSETGDAVAKGDEGLLGGGDEVEGRAEVVGLEEGLDGRLGGVDGGDHFELCSVKRERYRSVLGIPVNHKARVTLDVSVYGGNITNLGKKCLIIDLPSRQPGYLSSSSAVDCIDFL